MKKKMTAGFTLVELIVVIAILGILAGVGTVGYSGYIKKANEAKDIQMISQIKNALEIAGYDSTANLQAGIVKMDKSGTTVEEDTIKNVLVEAFGSEEAVQNLTLSADWSGEYNVETLNAIKANYTGSAYDGNEKGLLNDVQTLTDAFAAFAGSRGAQIAGDNFLTYLDGLNVDATNDRQVANSAALYVAERTSAVDTDAFVAEWQRNSFSLATAGVMGNLAAQYAQGEAMMAYYDQQRADNNVTTKLSLTDIATGAEKEYNSYAEWYSEQSKTIGGTNTTQVENTLATLKNSAIEAVGPNNAQAYLASEQAKKDAKGYLAALGAIKDSKAVFTNNITKQNLYNDGMALSMLNSYKAVAAAYEDGEAAPGSVMLSGYRDADGAYRVSVYPAIF